MASFIRIKKIQLINRRYIFFVLTCKNIYTSKKATNSFKLKNRQIAATDKKFRIPAFPKYFSVVEIYIEQKKGPKNKKSRVAQSNRSKITMNQQTERNQKKNVRFTQFYFVYQSSLCNLIICRVITVIRI